MTNRFFSPVHPDKTSGKAKAKRQPEPPVSINEKTANWGGLPGKTQPKDRSNGVSKLNAYPKKEGL